MSHSLVFSHLEAAFNQALDIETTQIIGTIPINTHYVFGSVFDHESANETTSYESHLNDLVQKLLTSLNELHANFKFTVQVFKPQMNGSTLILTAIFIQPK